MLSEEFSLRAYRIPTHRQARETALELDRSGDCPPPRAVRNVGERQLGIGRVGHEPDRPHASSPSCRTVRGRTAHQTASVRCFGFAVLAEDSRAGSAIGTIHRTELPVQRSLFDWKDALRDQREGRPRNGRLGAVVHKQAEHVDKLELSRFRIPALC
jgi:hypothetical protein